MKKGLSASTLKMIAIFAMTIDHIAWVFFTRTTVFSFFMHIIGRLTFPIMAFFIANGYIKTQNIKKYLLRLFLYAVLSMLPFYLVFGTVFNVIFTLLFGLLAIYIHDHIKNVWIAGVLVFLLACLSMSFDWGFIGVYMIYGFYVFRNNKYGILITALGGALFLIGISLPTIAKFGVNQSTIMNFMHIGVLLAVPLLSFYNGMKGRPLKHLFYVFYPFHLLVIFFIKMILRG